MTSTDPEEIAKFEQLADLWWDQSGPFWPLHKLNAVRTHYIADGVVQHFGLDPQRAQPLQGVRMLDIGCGGGLLSESMAALGGEVLGIDVVERNINIARRHKPAERTNLTYEHTTVEALAETGQHFDVVLNMEVVEHVANLPSFMQACCSLVDPRGQLFVSTINRNLLSFVTTIIGAEYVLRWLPRGTHDWRKFPKPGELTQMLEAANLQVTARRGVRVNPITRHFSLTDSLAINYMLVATAAPDAASNAAA